MLERRVKRSRVPTLGLAKKALGVRVDGISTYQFSNHKDFEKFFSELALLFFVQENLYRASSFFPKPILAIVRIKYTYSISDDLDLLDFSK